MKKELSETKEDKTNIFYTGIGMLDNDEFIALTPFSERIGIHFETIKRIVEKEEKKKQTGWTAIRSKDGEIKGIMKTEKDLDLKLEIEKLRKEIKEIKNILLKKDG